VNDKSGSELIVEQSTCFYFPGPKASVILLTILVGPTIIDVPVSIIAEALPVL
jgi:hypothetical protein